MSRNMKKNTKQTISKTQIDSQVVKKSYTHDANTCKQASRWRICVRETETIIGKTPRLGSHTRERKLYFHHAIPSVM